MKTLSIDTAITNLEVGIEAYSQLLQMEKKVALGLESYSLCSLEAEKLWNDTPTFVGLEANSITDMAKKAYEYLSKLLKSIWDWIKSKFTKESEKEVEVLEGEFMAAADEVDSSDKRTTPDVSNIVKEFAQVDKAMQDEIVESLDSLNERKKAMAKRFEERRKQMKEALGEEDNPESKVKSREEFNKRMADLNAKMQENSKKFEELNKKLAELDDGETVVAVELTTKSNKESSNSDRLKDIMQKLKDLDAKPNMDTEELEANAQLAKGYLSILRHYQRKRHSYVTMLNVGVKAAKACSADLEERIRNCSDREQDKNRIAMHVYAKNRRAEVVALRNKAKNLRDVKLHARCVAIIEHVDELYADD